MEWIEGNVARLLDREAQTKAGRNWVADKDAILAAIAGLTWEKNEGGEMSLPFSPGMVIQAAAQEFKWRAVYEVATNGAIEAMDDFEGPTLVSLYGVHHRDADGEFRLYIADEGTQWFVVAYEAAKVAA